MKKKMIFITIGAGILGFSGMFSFAWFSKPKPQAPADTPATVAARQADAAFAQLDVSIADEETEAIGGAVKTLSEKQLKTLIYEVREKIEEYNTKLKGLELREKRMQVAHEQLRADIEEMSGLRVDLASAVSVLKTEQENLIKSKVEIAKIEQANLKTMAATYDKMDADSASKIIINMIQVQRQGSGFDDAVKILYYMTERTKAKVLASIATTEPAVSAVICQRLKQTIEGT